MKFKLGKNPARHDPRSLKLSRYILPTLPLPPDSVDWSNGIAYGMLANDAVGDCAIAGPDHLMQTWTGDNGSECPITDAQALADYSAVSGYVAGEDSTDNGCVLLDVLKRWKNFGLAGRKILAFASVNLLSQKEVRTAAWLFGGLIVGLQLPQSAMDQVDAGQDWSIVADSPNLGGHCVCITAYDVNSLTCVTWGKTQRMTWDFFGQFCDEAWAAVSNDWAGTSRPSPAGFDVDALLTDLAAL